MAAAKVKKEDKIKLFKVKKKRRTHPNEKLRHRKKFGPKDSDRVRD